MRGRWDKLCDFVLRTLAQINVNVNFRVFILPYESMEELSKTVYSYAPAEKSSIQPWINSINVSSYVT